MAKWRVTFTPEARNDLNKLDRDLLRRINEKLDWLEVNFNNIKPLALGSDWRGFFKLRISDWRVIYKVDWNRNLIIIWLIDRRDKVYKRRKPDV